MRYYHFDQPDQPSAPELFPFRLLTTRFEPVDGDTCAPVLYANTVADMISFSLQACVERSITVRRCKNCGRYYRVDIEDTAKQHFSVLHVACPYCGTTMSGEVHKTAEAFSYIADIQNGREPYFGLELWFLTSFQGKPVWALNREHLAYLIDYLSADLREKPLGRAKKTQSDSLPTFMKTAKNRERIVKLLKKLQEG